MCRILIFGGASEGRELAEFCAENGIPACVSVTTDFGASLLEDAAVHKGKMTEAEMLDFITKNRVELTLDATHPHAREATENIRRACEKAGVRRLRVLRERSGAVPNGLYFDTIDEAVNHLSGKEGNVFVTTGSKELAAFCRLENFSERCAVRVLPQAAESCAELGFAQVITGVGPFTLEQNLEHMKKYSARYLVTKDSGPAGGLGEKLAAAKELGAEILILKRPDEEGISPAEAKKILLGEKRND